MIDKTLYLSLLRAFCSKDERETLRTPWKSGSNYFASDGISLIMIPTELTELDVFDDTNINKRPNALAVIPTERMEPIVIERSHMHEYLADKNVKRVEGCKECGGRGTVECNYGHDHDCPECGGEGEITIYDKMTINGVVFRSELLQRVLLTAWRTAETTIKLTHYQANKLHLFEIGKVIVLILPTLLDDEEKRDKSLVNNLKKLI